MSGLLQQCGLFSFLLGGANVGDLYMNLKVSDLNFETRYIRTRTRNKTKGQIAPFQVQESALELNKGRHAILLAKASSCQLRAP